MRSYDQAVKKDVVKAILLDGNTHEAVAERFGIPLSTVTHWVQRAKKAQAKVMADADADVYKRQQAFSRAADISLPLFLDNRESVTDLTLPDEMQVINLNVIPGEKLGLKGD